MKILVAVKHAVEYRHTLRISVTGGGGEQAHLERAINPYDEVALEMALQLRERGRAGSVTTLTIGQPDALDTCYTALAMGADRAIHVPGPAELSPLAVARLLRQAAQQETPDLILTGRQSATGDHGQTGAMLAALLDWPQATAATSILVRPDRLRVTRRIEHGTELLELVPPAVITCDVLMATPRYVTAPHYNKARQMPVETLDLDVDAAALAAGVVPEDAFAPPGRPPARTTRDPAELVRWLRDSTTVLD
ncbi:MAG: electron transfer flavoprotein subunit beta/FixA family protein [Alphaproteobacteria bacterium]